MIIAPYFGSILGISSKFDNTERRTLAKFPSFTIENRSSWSTMLTQYFNDNFGFRNIFLQSYKIVKINFLKNQLLYRDVYASGWIFEPGGTDGQLKDYYSKAIFTNNELSSIKNRLEEEKALLAKKHIPYIVIIVPKKQSIYPEYYPFKNDLVFDLKLNQLTNYLKSTTIDFIDLRPALLASKSEMPLYYRTDTHWTNYGAFIGYNELMKHFSITNPKIQPLEKLEKSDLVFQLDKYQIWNGDISGQFYQSPTHPDFGVSFKIKNQDKINPMGNVLIFGDSYIHTKRGLTKEVLTEMFPELKNKLDLLFKTAPYRDVPLDMYLPKKPIEELIPVIKNQIKDPEIQQRLITFLINSGVKDDDLEGIARFLLYSFKQVALEDKDKPLTDAEIEKFQPSLVIRETDQMTLEMLQKRDDSYQKQTMVLSLKENPK